MLTSNLSIDESIETPELDDPSRENGNKDFASIELETPKLVFCEASLQAIADVLDLLKSNFTCITHGSCVRTFLSHSLSN